MLSHQTTPCYVLRVCMYYQILMKGHHDTSLVYAFLNGALFVTKYNSITLEYSIQIHCYSINIMVQPIYTQTDSSVICINYVWSMTP